MLAKLMTDASLSTQPFRFGPSGTRLGIWLAFSSRAMRCGNYRTRQAARFSSAASVALLKFFQASAKRAVVDATKQVYRAIIS